MFLEIDDIRKAGSNLRLDSDAPKAARQARVVWSNKMKEKEFSQELIDLLGPFEAAGGVLDYVLLQIEESLPMPALHKLAAVTAIEIIDTRLYEWQKSVNPTRSIDDFHRLTWDANSLVGQQISFEKFWGFDKAKIIRSPGGGGVVPNVDGYKTAFFLPPYSLHGDQDMEVVFSKINNLLFGFDRSPIEIYEWSTDWSNYFDPGHEWWGAFFWTLRRPSADWMIAIGASSSD